jgi:hypothetical protein
MKSVPALTALILPWLVLPIGAQEPAPSGPRPPVEFILAPGQAKGIPFKKGVAYANGGVIDVAQPNPTTIVVTMTGLTATNADLLCQSVAGYRFVLAQRFEVVFHSRRVKSAQLTLEGRVVGLLRTDHSHHAGCLHRKKCGTAETMPAVAAVIRGPHEVMGLTLPPQAAGDCEDLSVYNHDGPLSVPVQPGKYTLQETWGFGTTHPAFHCRGASAEFSPQPSYLPASYWLSEFRPFNGLATRDFGFRVTLRVIPEFKVSEEKPAPEEKP